MNLRRLLLRSAVAVPLALAAAAGSAWLVLSLSGGKAEDVTVPDLRGLELAPALESASRRELAMALSGYAYDASVPAHRVVSQSPLPGAATRKNRILKVVLSRGPRDITVPALAGMDLWRATLTLTQTGLAVGKVSSARVTGTVAGAVVAQTPPAPALLSRGEPVDLLLSEGPRRPLLVMSDLTSLPLAEALRFLRGFRLVAGTITSQSRADLPPGTVTATSPAGGHPVAEGATVDLTVSSAPAP